MAGDIQRTDIYIEEPATLKIGSVDGTKLKEIVAGTLTLDLPSIGANTSASASAAVTGLTTSHRVFVLPQAWATADFSVYIVAAVGIAGGVQVTAANNRSAAQDATSQTFQFFSFRN